MSSEELPPNWTKVKSKSTGKEYYYNTVTHESTYEVPKAESALGSSEALCNGIKYKLPKDWIVVKSSSTNKEYFFNKVTQKSTYEPPPGAFEISSSSFENSGNNMNWSGVATQRSSEAMKAPVHEVYSSAVIEDKQATLMVASAYDNLKDLGREGRNESKIYHLRQLNNWVKSTLIAKYAPNPTRRVLDLACGKLGDLMKWKAKGVHEYCGMDRSSTAVEDASERFNSLSAQHITGKLVQADLGHVDFKRSNVFLENEKFDAISIQFALHYLFQTEARALTFFHNLSDLLVPGGVFLGTIPDASVLIRNLRNLKDDEVKFGNSIYQIEFSPESKAAQYAIGQHPYGIKYNFHMIESVDHVDEYLVPWELLESLANSVGLVAIAKDNFQEFFLKNYKASDNPQAAALLSKLKVLDCEGTISDEVWEASGIYRIFAFRKPQYGEPGPTSPINLQNIPLDTILQSTANSPPLTKIVPRNQAVYRSFIRKTDIISLLE